MNEAHDTLASVSDDGTAFLFKSTTLDNITPCGFVQLPSAAVTAAFAARPAHLVVACRWTWELALNY